MSVKTFNRGVLLPHYKESTEDKAIATIALPREVVIPLQQHIGAPCKAVVSVGDKVKTGQKIGDSEAFVSAAIFASVDGTVTAIEPRPDFTGVDVESVVIEVAENQEEPSWSDNDISNMSGDDIKKAIREAGIVGMGGAAFPTSVKLSPPKPVDVVIINACECEPFLTCDHRVMVEMAEELVLGAKLIAKTVDAQQLIFGVETNKPDGIEAIKAHIEGEEGIEVVELDVKYPQGAEKQLIHATTGREVPPGKLPLEVGTVVQNVGTAVAVYEACRYGKPLYERVLTVTGDAAANPSNVKVPNGTTIGHVIEQCGGFKDGKEPGKVVMGGPMTGFAQTMLDIPVVKGTSGILLFSEEMLVKSEHMPCVRCSRCVVHCPMYLYPNSISTNAEKGLYDQAVEWGAMDCFECGICVYVCPSNRPIVQLVRDTKKVQAAK
ncbi:MAG: electron transport complex subunit RsxC [Bacillota bacterium]